MTDQELRKKRFDYQASQVIQREPQGIINEPTGESESLKGRIDLMKMGDLALKEKPTRKQLEQDPQKPKKKKKKKISVLDANKKTRIKLDRRANILSQDQEEHNIYKPKTKENRVLYENVLQVVSKALAHKYGDVPQDQLKSVNNEVLAILKTENLKDKDKQNEIEILIGSTSETFDGMLKWARQVNFLKKLFHGGKEAMVQDVESESLLYKGISNPHSIKKMDLEGFYIPPPSLKIVFQITDFNTDIADQNVQQEQKIAEDREANVYAEDESEEEEEDQESVDEEQSEDDDYDEKNILMELDKEEAQGIRATGGIEIEGDDKNQFHVDVNELEAFWLQQQINKYFQDPSEAKKLEQQVLDILSMDENECEKKLIFLLGHDKFNLISLLTKNRLKIFYCTLINQAQDQQEKQKIKYQMRQSEQGRDILESMERQGQSKTKQSSAVVQMKKEVQNLAKLDKMQVEQDDQQILGIHNITDEEFNRIGKKIIDFDKISFQQGAHYMSNDKCKLPQDSYRVQKQGYDEVYVNAVQQKSQTQNLIKIESMPSWAQKPFDNIKSLNVIQSKVYETAFNSPENMLVCAPTGAGKTNVALLTMLQVIGNYINQDGSIELKKFKMVYIAPMKALVSELVGNFTNILAPYKIKVKELTGDMQLTKQQIEETQLIIATPEKWDIITRKSGDKTYTQLVKLLIIDEIHLLHDQRGPVLEALVSRTIRNIEQTQEMVRIVGLSATLPNYVDVASFIRVKAKKGLFYFDGSYRPVPLEQQYIGITEKKAVRKMMLMNEILYEKVMERAGKFPMIIFVHSRRDTVKTAQAIKEMAFTKDELGRLLPEESDSKKVLTAVLEKEKIYSQELKDLLPYGFAVHHAGLSRLDRDLVEHLFADKHIQVLVSTSTLAWGVNLPAHTVMIKGTQVYSPEQGRWVELSPQDVLQMIGRAGRPGYDTKGEGIIITSYQELKYYLSLLNQQLPIESQFVNSLSDQLNAEIVLGTVTNLREAVHWLGYTYFYLRMLRNPGVYGLSQDEIEEDPLLVKRRVDLIHTSGSLLDKHGLIKYDKKTGNFQLTQLGKIASHYYIKYPSIMIYNENLKSNMGMIELIRVFSLSNEFRFIPIREEEKSELAKMIETVPIPIKGSPDDPATKINILLQCYIGRLPLDGFALNADMVYVTQSAGRITRAIFEICLKKNWATIAENALNLCKMIDKRMWGCMTLLRQFKGIPEEILRRIERKEQFTFEHFYNMTPQQIGELVKIPKLGKVLHKMVHQFPKLDLQPYLQPITRSCLKIDLTIKVDFEWEDKVHGYAEPFWIFVIDCNGEEILYHEYIMIKHKYAVIKDYIYQFTVPLFENLHPLYYIKVISDRWIQSETILPISFKNLILPEKFAAPTELYDLQLLPVSTLEDQQAQGMFKEIGITQFNSIQTQVYQNFYTQDENIFLGAPTGSGKTACILLAILRAFRENPGEKIIYIAPYQPMCRLIYDEWKGLFKKYFNKTVAFFTGQINTDTQLLDKFDLIISNPEYFDILSRRWKSKRSFQKIALFIADELHLLNENNSVLEVITSRMRYISSQLQKRIQIIGCATSVADYREMSAWIGASQKSSFNFHPNVRPYPLDIIVSGFDQIDLKTRLLSMKKQMYQGIKQFTSDDDQKQTIIFVSDRKQARICALDLMTLASSDNQPERFLKIEKQKLKPFTEKVSDHILSVVLEVGIGFLYEGQPEEERQIVEDLYKIGAIQVIISTYILSWEISFHSYLVIILDNQRYDGAEKRYIDYTIPDTLQMIGRSKHTRSFVSSKCIVMCQSAKKNFYKKFLFEPVPVESSLNQNIQDHICSEIIAKTITNKQDCVDWITWTFMYWRLTQNPNYYNLQDVSGTAINDYLSDLIENTLEELENLKCIAIEGDNELLSLNFGIISSYYYISNQTVQIFVENIKEDSKLKHLIEILSNPQEFDKVPIRPGEDPVLRELSKGLEYKIEKTDFNEPSTKTNVLLQCHFNRTQLSTDFIYDQRFILEHAVRLCHAMIDVISSSCWLQQDIKMMQLCQMIIQAQWANQSPLLQLPFFDQELVSIFKQNKIEDIPDFLDMEEELRNKLLSHLKQQQIEKIADFTNKYPSITMQWELSNEEGQIYEEEIVHVAVQLEREGDEEYDFVCAPYYPIPKEELWWVLIGDKKINKLYCIKRINLKQKAKIDLKFEAPQEGQHDLSIYLICDSYIGCDQVEQFTLKVQPGMADDDGKD